MGLVQELKKGNRTLETKVIELQRLNEKLAIENNDLRVENYKYRAQIASFESEKKRSEQALINYFGEKMAQFMRLTMKGTD